MKVLFFIIGFLTCLLLVLILNRSIFKKAIKKRRKAARADPDDKITTTKVVLFSILFTYYAAFMLAVYVVIFCNTDALSDLLTFVGGATVFAVAFYCWKAKAENLEKIKKRSPDMESSLSDFANMASQ